MASYTYRSGRVLAVATLATIGCLGAAMTLLAQDQDQPSRREARGRLPNYYTQVVDEEQRDEIYVFRYASEQSSIRPLLHP